MSTELAATTELEPESIYQGLSPTDPGASIAASGERPARSLKVLFVNDFLPQEMLGIMYLSRSIKDAGHRTKALFLPDKDWVQKLKEYAPDVVCFSVTTGMHLYSFDVAKRVKTELPNSFVLFGGPHPTFSPEMIEKNEHVDAVCRGEGEVALVELLNHIANGTDYQFVQNLWVRDPSSGEVHKNPQRPPIADIDSLGFPDRSIVYDAVSYTHLTLPTKRIV